MLGIARFGAVVGLALCFAPPQPNVERPTPVYTLLCQTLTGWILRESEMSRTLSGQNDFWTRLTAL